MCAQVFIINFVLCDVSYSRYNVLLTILIYFLPICAMGYAYFQVGVELWGSQTIGENTDHQMENIKSKRRVSHTIIKTFALLLVRRTIIRCRLLCARI